MADSRENLGPIHDGPVRTVLKLAAAMCYAVDVRINRIIRNWRQGRYDFELRGQCVRCGACCQTPCVSLPAAMYHLRLVRRLVLAWQVHVNGFVLVSEDRREHTFVFKCRHYRAATRDCANYRTRPGMCRDYPHVLLQSSNPLFLDGCGYYAHYRNADAMRQALRDLDLPPEKLSELEEKLHLRE